MSKQKRPDRDRRRSTVEINLIAETKTRSRPPAARRGCLGFGGVFILPLAGLLVVWAGLH